MAKAKAAERVATQPVILSPKVHGFFAAMDGAIMSFSARENLFVFTCTQTLFVFGRRQALFL